MWGKGRYIKTFLLMGDGVPNPNCWVVSPYLDVTGSKTDNFGALLYSASQLKPI